MMMMMMMMMAMMMVVAAAQREGACFQPLVAKAGSVWPGGRILAP